MRPTLHWYSIREDGIIDSKYTLKHTSSIYALPYIICHKKNQTLSHTKVEEWIKTVKENVINAIMQMERATLLIPQIRNDTRNWTARVTITEDIPILASSRGLQLKRYVFTDDEIMATIFADIIPVFSPVLQLYKVYEISGAQVRFVQPEYRILDQSQTMGFSTAYSDVQ
ncbi:hypothetical protein Leryth_004103 [Lithospermum erythrorhizon]|nr:hypothetical protein Leryth_004103 [Lithospermum erythrorhizon]